MAILAVLEFLKGRRVLYAVPTGDQIQRFWAEVVQALAEPIEFGVFKKLEGEKIIELPGTEQRIRAKTAWNADSLRGDYADVLILDEWQLMNEDAWETVGAPMLIDNNGDAIFIYTPPSLHSRSAQKARDPRHAAKMFKAAEKDARWFTTHFTSHDNPHVSEQGIAEVSSDMTQLAIRQEILAEDIDEVPGALWSLDLLDRQRVTEIPREAGEIVRAVVGVDPTGSSTNEAGIVGGVRCTNGHGYLLKDASLLAPTPRVWGQRAVWTYYELKADRMVGERNYGGDMIRELIVTVDENVSYKDVTATKGKTVRAEPICALYEKGLLHHVGLFPQLEEELISYVPGLTKVSPNRMDAAVWMWTELFPENIRLGLVELINEEQNKRAVQKEEIAKVATNDSTLRCPECQYHGIAKRGPIFRCGSCGHQWGTANVQRPNGPGPRANI